MPAKDELKSARKKFLVMRVKGTIMQSQDIPDEEVDAKLNEILASLTKTFGADVALQVLDDAIVAADAQMTGAIGQAISDTVKAEIDKQG